MREWIQIHEPYNVQVKYGSHVARKEGFKQGTLDNGFGTWGKSKPRTNSLGSEPDSSFLGFFYIQAESWKSWLIDSRWEFGKVQFGVQKQDPGGVQEGLV